MTNLRGIRITGEGDSVQFPGVMLPLQRMQTEDGFIYYQDTRRAEWLYVRSPSGHLCCIDQPPTRADWLRMWAPQSYDQDVVYTNWKEEGF